MPHFFKLIGFAILLFICSFIISVVLVGNTPIKMHGIIELYFFTLVIAIFLGFIPAYIAHKKGRSIYLWWIYGWLMFIVALIHAIVISPTEEARLQNNEKKCPYCAEFIKQEAKFCRYCGKEVS